MQGSSCSTSSPNHADVSVLVVEDEQVSRRALSWLLNSCGYKVESVASGEEAFTRLNQVNSPTVALVDVDLPGMSGLDLVTALDNAKLPVFVVLITAAGGERIAKFRMGRKVSYMRKPLDFENLLNLLNVRQLPEQLPA